MDEQWVLDQIKNNLDKAEKHKAELEKAKNSLNEEGEKLALKIKEYLKWDGKVEIKRIRGGGKNHYSINVGDDISYYILDIIDGGIKNSYFNQIDFYPHGFNDGYHMKRSAKLAYSLTKINIGDLRDFIIKEEFDYILHLNEVLSYEKYLENAISGINYWIEMIRR